MLNAWLLQTQPKQHQKYSPAQNHVEYKIKDQILNYRLSQYKQKICIKELDGYMYMDMMALKLSLKFQWLQN